MSLLFIPALLSLGAITYQDLRYRAISWYWIPVSAILLVWLRTNADPGSEPWKDWMINFSFLLLQLSLLLGYFFFRGISIGIFLQRYMGVGDLLFFTVLALALPFPTFPLFFTISLLLALITGLTLFKGRNIPLAGIQALLLALLLISEALHLKIYLPPNLFF